MKRAIPGGRLPVVLVLLALGQTVPAQSEPRSEHALPLVMSASHPVQQGFVRIINRSNRPGTVSIHAIDDSGQRFGPISLSLGAKETVNFNSEDLERGNRSKGLPSGVGSGDGDWRLELETELDIEPLGYIRTSDGFVTSMHDIVAGRGSACPPTDIDVPIFNPASNRSQRSWLRLINPGDRDINVTIEGQDDAGEAPPEGNVRLEIAAGAARAVTAQALESGGAGLDGRFGDGAGKWQLFVSADGAIRVMNLLQSATGNLTNLSTTPGQEEALRREEPPRAGSTSYELQSSVLRTDWRAFVSLDHDKFVNPPAYGDFDCDGDEDVFAGPFDHSAWFPVDNQSIPTPVRVYANDGDGRFSLATGRFIKGDIPEVILPSKALIGDFNGDGRPDIFIVDAGPDVPPYPGGKPVLLLSSDDGLRSAAGLEQVVGSGGGASGDIDQDGDLDIYMANIRQPVFLINDGLGNFVRDPSAVPTELTNSEAFTSEIIDVDDDGYLDLLVAGHEDRLVASLEYEGTPSAIYWGDDSGRYDASRMTTLPSVAGQEIVVDIDAEDLDGDGDRDIVLDRAGSDPYYVGHYIQIVANHGSRRFADETAQRITTDSFRATARWHESIRLQDVDGDGDQDIWVDDIHNWGRTWVNDGSGRFTELTPAGFAPMDDYDFAARFVGKQMNSISFVDSWRFVATREGIRHTNTGYRYTNTGTDTGSIELHYNDIGVVCTLLLSFDSETTGTLTYTCSDGDTGAESWRLEDIPGT